MQREQPPKLERSFVLTILAASVTFLAFIAVHYTGRRPASADELREAVMQGPCIAELTKRSVDRGDIAMRFDVDNYGEVCAQMPKPRDGA